MCIRDRLGAILAVVVLYWNRMFPFQFKDKAKPVIRKDIFSLWFKVVVACIPGAAVTILFDDYIEAHLHTPVVIAIALIFYGVAFILIENWNKTREPKIKTLADISYQTAFMIGLFQVLSIIPGTSRSGATIIGGLIIGVSRVAVAAVSYTHLSVYRGKGRACLAETGPLDSDVEAYFNGGSNGGTSFLAGLCDHLAVCTDAVYAVYCT